MKILVVEDEQKVATFVRAGLESQGFQVEVSHNGNDALKTAQENPFDALILDIMLPGRDGISLLRRLRAEHNAVPVLLLTARGDLDERVEGLNAGADDYLPKPFSMTELVARLRAVLRRRTGEGLSVLRCGELVINVTTRVVRRGDTPIQLTPLEFSLLECLLRTPGRIVTRIDILQTVWNNQFDPGTNVVEVAIQRLRRKVDEPFAQPLIQTVRRVGYVIQASP